MAAQRAGALLIDIRRVTIRRHEGDIPGALCVAGPLREWRLGPRSATRVCDLGSARAVVLIGDGDHGTVLAASALYGLGITPVADVVGGFTAWRDAGMPVVPGGTLAGRVVDGFDEEPPPASVREPVAVGC